MEKYIENNATISEADVILNNVPDEYSLYRFIIENANVGVLIVKNGKFYFSNAQALEMAGYAKSELKQLSYTDIIHPRDRKTVIDRHIQLLNGEKVQSIYHFRLIDKTGGIKWIEVNSSIIQWENEPATLDLLSDITHIKTEENQLREIEDRYKMLFQYANEAIFIQTESAGIIDANEKACEMFGYAIDELTGMDMFQLHPETEDSVAIYSNPYSYHNTPIEIMGLCKDGSELSLESSITPIVSGRQTLFMTIIRDITKRKKAEEKIRRLAMYDQLTGIPNRNLFFDRLNQSIHWAERYKQVVAVLYIDLDQFKPINDTLGHQAGDFVLKEVTRRFKLCIRKSDTLARLGGDEFVIILKNVQKKKFAQMVAKKIIQSVNRAIKVSNRYCIVGASIGISVYPIDANSAEDLLQQADTAMYKAKDSGKNMCCFYCNE